MAVKQGDGTTAVTSTSTKNDYGTVRNGGTVVSPRFTAKNLGDTDYQGSPSLFEGMPGTDIAEAGGTFGTMTPTSFIIRRITTQLAGIANTSLLSGGSDFGQHRSVHSSTTRKTTFLVGISWEADKDGQPTYTLTQNTSDLDFGTDDAAAFSYAIPGELTINQYGTPVNKDYSARTSG